MCFCVSVCIPVSRGIHVCVCVRVCACMCVCVSVRGVWISALTYKKRGYSVCRWWCVGGGGVVREVLKLSPSSLTERHIDIPPGTPQRPPHTRRHSHGTELRPVPAATREITRRHFRSCNFRFAPEVKSRLGYQAAQEEMSRCRLM